MNDEDKKGCKKCGSVMVKSSSVADYDWLCPDCGHKERDSIEDEVYKDTKDDKEIDIDMSDYPYLTQEKFEYHSDNIKDDDEEMIEAHWEYVESICEKMYKDAFKHGLKHGREEDDR